MTETELEIERRYALRPIRWREICKMTDEELLRELKRNDTTEMKCGWLFRWGSCWIGGHWSAANKHLCVNLIPFVTIWFVLPGGYEP